MKTVCSSGCRQHESVFMIAHNPPPWRHCIYFTNHFSSRVTVVRVSVCLSLLPSFHYFSLFLLLMFSFLSFVSVGFSISFLFSFFFLWVFLLVFYFTCFFLVLVSCLPLYFRFYLWTFYIFFSLHFALFFHLLAFFQPLDPSFYRMSCFQMILQPSIKLNTCTPMQSKCKSSNCVYRLSVMQT